MQAPGWKIPPIGGKIGDKFDPKKDAMAASFGTHPKPPRQPAEAGKPIVDPAGWSPDEIRDRGDLSYHLTGADIDDITAAVAGVKKRGIDIVDIRRDNFPLPRFAEVLGDVRAELLEGLGFATLRGLPVADLGKEGSAIAFFGLGCHLGQALSQNAAGHVLGHIKDLGLDYNAPLVRGYQTGAAMGFHTDQCDYAALLCLQTAKSGGESRVASSITLYNRMLERRPDLVAELTSDFYWDRHGEIPPGEEPWYKNPVFNFERGYFSGRGISNTILKAQRLPGVPPFTEAQKQAIEMFRALVPECAVDIEFQPGDMQILQNHVMLHTRTAFEDWPEPERKRHLYRLWLEDPDGRPIPKVVRDTFRGVEVEGFTPKAPLEADAAA